MITLACLQCAKRHAKRLFNASSIGILVTGTALIFGAAAPTRGDDAKKAKPLDGKLLKEGWKLLPKMPNVDLNIVSPVQLGLANVTMPIENVFDLHICVPININGRNDVLGKEEQRRNALLAETNTRLHEANMLHIQSFEYQQMKDLSLLRKPIYKVPEGKLVVIVADFSSGNPGEGCEAANEIAARLDELKKHGIDIHVIVGEVKPETPIRSEEMAIDLGKHLPPKTNFVVIWGTMSPLTVGRFRPHLTSVQRTEAEKGIAGNLTIMLESEELPLRTDDPKYQQECWDRLFGATCAAIPSYYAANEISWERKPDLTDYFNWIGSPTPEVTRFKDEVDAASRWPKIRKNRKLEHVHRVSPLFSQSAFPSIIHNGKDDSVMVLITDEKGAPRRFRNRDGQDEVVYIDIGEVTNTQFVTFLNAKKGNQDEGGAPWLQLTHTEEDEIGWSEERKEFEVLARYPDYPGYCNRCPVVNVSWYAGKSYCEWAGKELPTKDEWLAAAQPRTDGFHPWGKDAFDPSKPQSNLEGVYGYRRPVGSSKDDRSRIGCFDMAGNVSEWCSDWKDEKKGRRVICGHCFQKGFRLTQNYVFGEDSVKGRNWLGFRGVLRIPVDN